MMKRNTSRRPAALAAIILVIGGFLALRANASVQKLSDLAYAGHHLDAGAVVIDIGINRIPQTGPDGKPVLDEKGKPKMKTVGDVDFDGAKEVAGYITPVPGGVGPVTVAMLLKNTVACAKAMK